MKMMTRSDLQTMALAKEFAKRLHPGDVVCLNGEMGAGKTHFVKGVLEGLGYADEVTSPTFALCHRYEKGLPFPVLHYDLYRINDYDDLYSIGFFEDVNEKNCVFIEWSNIADEYIEGHRIDVNIEYGENEGERIISWED